MSKSKKTLNGNEKLWVPLYSSGEQGKGDSMVKDYNLEALSKDDFDDKKYDETDLPSPEEVKRMSFANLEEKYSQDDNLRIYLKEICQVQPLSDDEELEFAKRASRGDQEAKEKLVEASLRLVVPISEKYANRGFYIIDLIQQGNDALLDAVDNFDWTKGNKFSAYANQRIQREIHDLLDSCCISYSSKLAEKATIISNCLKKLEQELGRRPTTREMFVELGLDIPEGEMAAELELDVPVGGWEMSPSALRERRKRRRYRSESQNPFCGDE